MRISRNSWHYRLPSRVWDSKPTNLCRYFWRCFFAVALFPTAVVVLMVVVATAVSLVAFVGSISMAILLGYEFSDDLVWNEFWLAFGAGLGKLSAMFLIWLTLRQTWKRVQDFRWQHPAAPKPPGILSSWLKARKGKVCPLIEIVD